MTKPITELARVLRDRTSLAELGVMWTATFGTRLEDDFPGRDLAETATEFWLRAEERKIFDTACAQVVAERPDLRADLGATAKTPGAPSKFINVPPRNDFFTGREEILERLDGTLKAEGRAAIKQAISGLGGIGKTQTAIEYAYRHEGDYARILWTGAESAAALTEGFADIADKLNLAKGQKSEERVAAVKGWLAENSGWLLILDNADAPELVADFLPTQFQGKVLLTSRTTNFDALGKCRPVTLEVMTTGEALAFLKERTGRPTLSESEAAAAKALAEELGYLPLALEQAAAYVAATKATFADYGRAYAKRRLRALEARGAVVGGYKATVATTWGMNFEAVERDAGWAADVLRMSAYCAPDGIPLELLEGGAWAISMRLAERREECLTANEVIEPLMRYSLVRFDEESESFSVHRLVQAVIQEGMDEATRREWIERGVKAVNAAFPDVTDFYQWGVCARLAPHGVALGEAAARAGAESAEVARLLNQTGYFLHAQGRYAETAPLFERSLAIFEKALGAEHPDTAGSLNNLAALYSAQGEYGRAEPLYERSLAIHEKALGAEHPDTAGSLNNLAALYSAQGEYGRAMPLYERSLAIHEKALGAEHPDTARGLNNLALLYDAQGDATRAEELHARALAVRIKILGGEHPDTARSRWNLAATLWKLERPAEARELHEAALAGLRAALGAEHPRTQACAAQLAQLPQEYS